MGRPKEFCVEGALEQALVVFWRHGFEGASMADLTAAMGITKPSLYACYGNKEDLFRQALDLYDRKYMGFTREALAAPTSREVATRILMGTVSVATDGDHPPGCASVNGALACSAAADPIKDEVLRRRGTFELAVRKRFEHARSDGDLPASTSPVDLARYVMIVAVGISFQAAAGATRSSLKRVAEIALRAWPAP